jgi:hypothetical protein
MLNRSSLLFFGKNVNKKLLYGKMNDGTVEEDASQ